MQVSQHYVKKLQFSNKFESFDEPGESLPPLRPFDGALLFHASPFALIAAIRLVCQVACPVPRPACVASIATTLAKILVGAVQRAVVLRVVVPSHTIVE